MKRLTTLVVEVRMNKEPDAVWAPGAETSVLDQHPVVSGALGTVVASRLEDGELYVTLNVPAIVDDRDLHSDGTLS